MLYIKAFHIIFMVAWFSGLFYLPRLFVYHAESMDVISLDRFKIMERRLYYGITWPSAVLTTVFGLILLSYNFEYYRTAIWMHAKLGFVIALWGYHLVCGRFVKQFANNQNTRTSLFFRYFNEVTLLFLIPIVLLVVVKP